MTSPTKDCLPRPPQRPAGRQQAGFTLIELLISMVLGMVIIGALVVMYTSGSSATRNAQAQGQMNEDAQMALAVLTQELRQAGYNPVRSALGARNDLAQGDWNLFACDNGFTDASLLTINALTLGCGGGGGFALAVAYEGDLSSGKNTIPGLPMDCIGNGVAAPVGMTYYIMQSRLYIANNALVCRGNGNLAQVQVLAENIESMTANFAVTEPVAGSKKVLGYLTASGLAVPADPALAALPLKSRWDRVVAAQLCVVVRSENPVLQDVGSADTKPSYQNCAGTDVDITDGRLRRAYRTTVMLRNHGVGYVDP
jgi:type IV pilus assembly protein PilW